MKIGGVIKRDPQNYSGKLAYTIFLTGCNFNCGYCHNPELAEGKRIEEHSEEEILNFLEHHTYVNGVCITGGEPTIQAGLADFLRKLKKIPRADLSVKLDTNGSRFEVLEELKKERLVDYVAMDVKAPREFYATAIGKDFIDWRDDVEKGIALTCQFPDYEFRTTIIPIDRENGNFSFMKVGEVADIAKWIADITGGNESKYYLQPFVKTKDSKLLDSRFEAFGETPKELLEEMRKEAIKYLPNCRIRT